MDVWFACVWCVVHRVCLGVGEVCVVLCVCGGRGEIAGAMYV